MNRPNRPKRPVTARATRVARRAATFRCRGDILRVSPRKTGSSPGGSRITHNVSTVEVKTYPYEFTALPSRGITLVGPSPRPHPGPHLTHTTAQASVPPHRHQVRLCGGSFACAVVREGQKECRGRWPGARLERGTIALPNGKQVTGIILRFASATGMPTIVMPCAMAVTTCPAASHIPAATNHTTLPIADAAPAPGFSTTALPNGHSAYLAIRSDATPNGNVTINRQARRPKKK